jgi:hypothetical protein
VTGLPPVEAGGLQVTVAEALAPLAVTPLGAPGAPGALADEDVATMTDPDVETATHPIDEPLVASHETLSTKLASIAVADHVGGELKGSAEKYPLS